MHQRLGEKGGSLIEILIAVLVIALTVLGVFGFFSYGIGGIKTQGNSRASLQQASARLDQLLAANVVSLNPPDGSSIHPVDGTVRWLTCSGSPCTWTLSTTQTAETVPVNGLGNRRMETTVQWIDDPSAGTSALDVLKLTVKVWFSTVTTDDDFHRVELRTLRTP